MTHPLVRAAGAVTAAGAAAVAWGALVEVRWYALREVTIPVLPPGQAPVRVLHLSDLHLVPTQRRKRDWVRDLATLQPDLVVDTGDNMAHVDALPAVLDTLEPLLTTPGAFVLGSNDYFAPRPKNPARYLLPDARRPHDVPPRELPAGRLAQELRAAGWKDLTTRRDVVGVDGRTLSLVGVDDPHLERDRFPAPDESVAVGGSAVGRSAVGRSAVGRSPAADLHLGVTHAPYRRVLDQMHADGCQVVLAGHTHGGQLAVPGFGALVTNCDLDRGRAKGLHGWPAPRPDEDGGEGSTWLHVSAGLGTSPYAPVRFACRPEATLVTLVGS
jgi:predicted MPP superfamily phosphohydrolase